MTNDAATTAALLGPQTIDQRLVRAYPNLSTPNGWTLKVYGIAHNQDEPRPDLLDAAQALADHALPQPAVGHGRHGVGFLIVHDGALGRWALYFWWSERILLHQRLYRSAPDQPLNLHPATDDGLIACVYELPVIAAERQAWLRHVLDGPGDLHGYLADHLRTQPAIGYSPPQPRGVTHVRPVRTDDRHAWRRLWHGYLAFYRNPLPESVTDATFTRLCTGAQGLHGLVAVTDNDHPVGLAHLVLHPATWTDQCYCYLEDLYVEPTWRGAGVAAQLIEAGYQYAEEHNAARVYWHTQEYNAPARSLYDRLGHRTSMIMYQR